MRSEGSFLLRKSFLPNDSCDVMFSAINEALEFGSHGSESCEDEDQTELMIRDAEIRFCRSWTIKDF